jgi:hypothetical protein
VEDSGGWNVFYRAARNGRGQIDLSIKPYIPNHHIGQTLIPYMPDIVKPLYQGLGIIHPKPWFVNRIVIYFWMKIAKIPGKFLI